MVPSRELLQQPRAADPLDRPVSSAPPFISLGIGMLGGPITEVPPELVAPRRRAAILVLMLCTASWGLNGVANRVGLGGFSAAAFVASRFAVASLLLFFAAKLRGKEISLHCLSRSVPVGVLLGLSVYCGVAGVHFTSVSRAGFLGNLFVVLIPVIGWLSGGGLPSRGERVGLALAGAGLLCFGAGGPGGLGAGDLLASLSALFIALHTMAVDRWTRGIDTLAASCAQFAAAAVTGLILVPSDALLVGPASSIFSWSAVVALLYSAVFPAAISLTLQNKFQKRLTAAQAGLIYVVDPLWCAAGAAVFLGERLTGGVWVGCLLLFSGVLVPSWLALAAERRAKIR